MEAWKKKALEANGYTVGDAGDFLGLSDEERHMVAARVALARAVRRRRETAKLSQGELAERIQSSQARVSKIESAVRGVSLDLMAKSLFAAGGDLNDLARAFTRPSSGRSGAPTVRRRR